MKYHLHVPKLHEFALEKGCDRVVLLGTKGLNKPMPYAVYLRCIQTLAARMRRHPTVMKVFNSRINISDLDQRAAPLFVTIMLVDHVVLNDANATTVIKTVKNMMISSDDDPQAVIDCLHRFAARCLAVGKHQLLVTVMSQSWHNHIMHPRYSHTFSVCRSICDVLILYGGQFTVRNVLDIQSACTLGLTSVLGTGYVTDMINHENLLSKCIVCAYESGSIELIKYLYSISGANDVPEMPNSINARNLDVGTCERLLSMNILKSHRKYALENVVSVDVVRWFADHDMLNAEKTVATCCDVALQGNKLDILRYLIDEMHLPVNVDLKWDHIDDVGALDLLIRHGAKIGDVPPNIMLAHLRLFIDHNVIFNDNQLYEMLLLCLGTPTSQSNVSLSLLVNNFKFDLTKKCYDLDRLISGACFERHDYGFVRTLFVAKHGANACAISTTSSSLMTEACIRNDTEAVRVLLELGAVCDEEHLVLATNRRNHEMCRLLTLALTSHGAQPEPEVQYDDDDDDEREVHCDIVMNEEEEH